MVSLKKCGCSKETDLVDGGTDVVETDSEGEA